MLLSAFIHLTCPVTRTFVFVDRRVLSPDGSFLFLCKRLSIESRCARATTPDRRQTKHTTHDRFSQHVISSTVATLHTKTIHSTRERSKSFCGTRQDGVTDGAHPAGSFLLGRHGLLQSTPKAWVTRHRSLILTTMPSSAPQAAMKVRGLTPKRMKRTEPSAKTALRPPVWLEPK